MLTTCLRDPREPKSELRLSEVVPAATSLCEPARIPPRDQLMPGNADACALGTPVKSERLIMRQSPTAALKNPLAR